MSSEGKQVVEELPGFVTLYSDGSVVRYESTDPSSPLYTLPATVLSSPNVSCHDVALNQLTDVRARIFFPRDRITTSSLPIVLHFHGGGFCVGSPFWQMYHTTLSHFCLNSGAIWVSVAYRLAPENRLPSGFHDCLDAIEWLRQLSVTVQLVEPELEESLPGILSRIGDFRRVFLVGDSAGGNLVYNAAVQASRDGKLDSEGFRVRGMALIHPGFKRDELSDSEKTGTDRSLVDIESVKVGARMALPEGETADYFLINPGVPGVIDVRLPPCLVFIAGNDIFRDRQTEFCERMREEGQVVEVVKHQEMGHCFFLLDEFKGSHEAADLTTKMVAFITSPDGR